MEDWVLRGMARWPDVPALYGWLTLDRRGRWLIRGEVITRPQIIETINRNYAADTDGCWYFQNGPQRGYVQLEVTPWIVTTTGDGERLQTHTGEPVESVSAAYLDEEGSILLMTEFGPALLIDQDLDWALQRTDAGNHPVDESILTDALERASGGSSGLTLTIGPTRLPLTRIDTSEVPDRFGFVRSPQNAADQGAV